ncbi:uncharacterized protein LOC130445298 [Diorhabda sublineata]|uniref:uncharacterized protein LOC130445298 n=1 Tax=Diorhabda sublineata TaxID=1163346 RepID=UPI0024E1174D|nr:uncharacterized protein LOC130445298 [Diorhabda sublineata]
MITDLNQKFVVFLEENPPPSTEKETFTDITKRFLNFLKVEGIYESYVSSITQATSLLVSKKFQRDDFQNSREFQKFVGEVFVFLISRMNQIVNTMMCHGMEPTTALGKTDKFFFFAKEAMDVDKPKLAERYLLERICNDANNADCWLDYGVYLLEQREDDKAYECMKEALLKREQHKYSLLVLGVLLCNKGQKEDAETCFLNLMIDNSTWSEGWAIFYLFYQKIDSYEGMDKTIEMANKYSDLKPPTDYIDEFDELVWTSTICPKTVFFRAAILLLKLRLYEWCELALSQEIYSNPGIVNYLLAAICYYKKLYRHAIDHIEETLKYYGSNYAVSSLAGHCLMALDRKVEAKEQYYHALESFDRPDHLHLTSINLARVLGELEEDQEARKFILLACKYKPTPYTWYLAGVLYYQENDLLSSEECFSEGNLMDNRFAEIWGYLALLNFKFDRRNEAELCLDQAIKNNLSDDDIIRLIDSQMSCRTSMSKLF